MAATAAATTPTSPPLPRHPRHHNHHEKGAFGLQSRPTKGACGFINTPQGCVWVEATTPRGVMGEPLSPDRVFDFPMDEPHPAYDYFAPASLPGYAGNPNNNNGWLAADDYSLGELETMVDEQMVIPAVDEIAEQIDVHAIEEVVEPVVEAEEEQVIAPVVDIVEGPMDATMMDMEEDLAVLFGDDDFEDDASDGFGEEEVWEVNEDWLMAPTTPPPMLA
ncbi:hypothetical protein Tco_0598944 [Tanacetum coccineum]